MTYKTIPVDSHSKMLAATKLRKLRALPILCPPRKVHMNQTTRYVQLGPLKYLGLKIIFEQHCFGRRALACPTLHNPPTFLSGYNESCPTGPEPRLGKPKRLFKSLQVPANWESWLLRLLLLVPHSSLWQSRCPEWGNFSWRNSGFAIQSASGKVSRSESLSEEIQSYLRPVKHQNSLLVGVKWDLICKMTCTIMRQTK